MDFSLSGQQEMLRELDGRGEFPFDIIKRAGHMGLVWIMTSEGIQGKELCLS